MKWKVARIAVALVSSPKNSVLEKLLNFLVINTGLILLFVAFNAFKYSIARMLLGEVTKDLSDLLINVKTKRYTFARIKRIVLHLLLNIKKDVVTNIYKIEKLPFIKVLAFKCIHAKVVKHFQIWQTEHF